MEIIFFELILWGALIFFIWALKDNLDRIETDIEDLGVLSTRTAASAARPAGYQCADKVIEPIGRYCDAPIYQYAIIGDQYYRFDRVSPDGAVTAVNEDECCLEPGLVYVAMPERPLGLQC